ncbi:ABC transporter ATP-binding protein [soil metagenome]
MSLLSVKGLSKRFGGLLAVNDLDLEVVAGEVIGLIGPNGAGKTTIVSLLTGTLKATTGKIILNGKDVTGLAPHERCRLGMTKTFQIPQPFSSMTVHENVSLAASFGRGGRVHSKQEVLRITARALELGGLAKMARESTSTMNTAGLKRLEVCRCLAAEPDLLLLDEPLGGLNPTEANEATAMMRTLKQAGITMLLVEHVVPAVMSISDRVVVLVGGAKLVEATPAEVLEDVRVQRAYLGDLSGALSRRAAPRAVANEEVA